jgi:5'-nucleotidase
MHDTPSVLLTNDDGIDALGLRSLRNALTETYDVTVVAPATNMSGVARADSRSFAVDKREAGYAIQGTPVDCVHYARGYLDTEFDAVVSGCNDGPNFGAHKLERSGTVAAAIEAAFLGLPGLAFSLYDHPGGSRAFAREDYELAEQVAAFLLERVVDEGLPAGCEYLNVNVPADQPTPRLRLTEPTEDFDVRVDETAEGFRVWDHFYDPLEHDNVPMTDAVGTDRRAIADEEVSVSPLSVEHRTPSLAAAASLVEEFEH